MALDSENFKKEIYDLLKVRRYKPIPLDTKNQRVPAAQNAEVFQFTFDKDGEDYGNAWVTIDDAKILSVYFDNKQYDSPNFPTPGLDYDDTWTGFLKYLKKWAQRRQLSFDLYNRDRLDDDMKQRDYFKEKAKLHEAYHPVNKKASYTDSVPNVKVLIQHSKNMQETDQRFRHVSKIFLENQDGERFLAPTTRPGVAKIYARHIAEGGVPNDQRWNHIKSLVEDYDKMSGFNRAVKNKVFENAEELINEGMEFYSSLKETLKKISTTRGYNSYFESWQPELIEDIEEISEEHFSIISLDPRIKEALPIMSKFHRKPKLKEVSELETWADKTIDENVEQANTYKNKQMTDYKKTQKDTFSNKKQQVTEIQQSNQDIPQEILALIRDFVFIYAETKAHDYDLDMDHRSVVDGDLHFIQNKLDHYGYDVYADPDYECVIVKTKDFRKIIPFHDFQYGGLYESALSSHSKK